MVPEGWNINTVGDLFDVQLGKMLNKDAKRKHPQVPYLTNFNVRWGAFDLRQLNTMHFSERDKEKFSLKYGDLIMCEGGEVGRCAIWKDQMQPCFYQKALHRLRPKKDILPDYFQSYMSYIAGTKLLDDLIGKTSIAHLTKEKLVELPVRVPPFSEQKKIVGILSTWDRAIEVTEKLLNNSQQQKKSLMQQLLTGKKRLPSFSDEWEYIELGSLAEYSKGYTYKSENYSDVPTQFGFYTLKSIKKGGGFNRTGIKFLTNKVDKKFEVKPGDIIFAITDITRDAKVVGAPVFVPELGLNFSVISMDMVRLDVADEIINRKFLFYALKLRSSRCFMRARASGSTVLHLDVKGSKKLKLKIPQSLCEQQKIASVLSVADKEIETLKQELECLRQEKKALMQQLLTGKRRVKVGEGLHGEVA